MECHKSIEFEAVFTKIEMINEWNVYFFSEYKVCHKSAEFESVFTKIEMNNEWNVYFFQNTRRVIKVSRLKLYLPR